MNILQFPDPTLLKPCSNIEKVDKEIKDLALLMLAITHEQKAIGLAANQIGILHNMFVMVLNNKDYIFINPKILKESGNQLGMEGCLSEKGRFINKNRPLNITIEYIDIHGKLRKKAFSSLGARCIAHEISHLSGRQPLED